MSTAKGHPDHGKGRGEGQGSEDRPQAAPSPDPEPETSAKGADEPAAQAREYRELVEQLQRLAAEYANYQKRMDARLREERHVGVRGLALDLLPAIDNLERTLAAAQGTANAAVLREGARIAQAELLAALRKHGVTPIDSKGRPFDPEHHEAIAHLPSEEHPSGHVMDEMQKGYRLHERTIRPSRVAVSSGKPGQPAPEAEEPKADHLSDE